MNAVEKLQAKIEELKQYKKTYSGYLGYAENTAIDKKIEAWKEAIEIIQESA